MWGFVQGNWATILFALAALACPLLHAFGHGGGHRHAPPTGKEER